MLAISLCLAGWLFASSMAVEKPVYDLEQADQLFEDFIVTYNKSYPHIEEKQKRFEIFKENLNRIIYLNSVRDAVRGIHTFADLTVEEFVSRYTGMRTSRPSRPINNCKIITSSDITTNDAPASFDWRDKNAVTPVKDQDPCGSCWAFSCTGSIEGQYAIKKGINPISISEQQLLDCLESSGHCNGGAFMVDVMSELKAVAGLESEKDYPYIRDPNDQKCKLDKSKVKVQVVDCYRFELTDEDQLKEALYKYGPISLGVYANPWFSYQSGIYTNEDCPSFEINHGVLLVGYGTEGGKDYWIIKNSWGVVFGEQGYIRISRGENTCGLMNPEATAPIIA